MQLTDTTARQTLPVNKPAVPSEVIWSHLYRVMAHPRSLNERGASIAEVLAYTALSVAGLVALFALFNALGTDVVTQVRQRLGLGG